MAMTRLLLMFVALLGVVIPFNFEALRGRGQAFAEGKHGKGVYLAGDVILGGLFPVHENSKDMGQNCGHKTYNRGIQRLEAMLYAVDTINADEKLLNGISLGVNILDTCGRDTYALNQSLEFIRSSLSTFDVNQYECSNGGGSPRLKFNTTGPILGVIGGSYSSVSIQVANLLRLFRIPQISPASTAKALSDKSRFEMFARTVPPDTFQAIALVDIVKKFNWTYVSTIASEGSYGESGIDVFQREAEKRNICIAIAEKVPSNADSKKFKEVVKNLLKKPNAKAVVLFTRAEDARGILKAAQSMLKDQAMEGQKFYWLASDGWGKQSQVVQGIEDFAVGAITVELESKKISGFDDYLKKLTPEKNERNFWFRDYWEDVFNCDVDQRSYEMRKNRAPKTKQRSFCNPKLRLTDLPSFEQDSKVQFVIDAVYAFAHALDALKKDVCPGWKGICPAITYYDGGDFYKNYLLKVDFEDMAESSVKFDENGDGMARYTIFNYQKNPLDGTFDYAVIGKWYSELIMEAKDVIWSSDSLTTTTTTTTSTSGPPTHSSPGWSPSGTTGGTGSTVYDESYGGITEGGAIPRSVCSFPCKTGEIMIMNTGDTCCWICQKCQDYEFMVDKFKCEDCGNGFWPHANKTGCYELNSKYMQWDTVFAIVPICIACLGIILTLTTVGVFIKFADTPLVRASGRELSYVILGGLLLCYLNTFILLAKPGIVVCALQRFSVGMGFSTVYGALLTKTNRISRIFHSASQSARRPSYISPRSQLIITAVLVSVQFLATVVWILGSIPDAERVYPQRSEVILKCNVNDSSFVISQVYNMVLISICTYYAVLTRKVPENFNEAKFIGFTMYTTCIIWLAFVPIYFGTGNSFEIQITTLCISISLSAYTTLFCLFSPKVYIIVFQPEKNVRKLTMNSIGQKKTTTSLVSTAAATAAMAANNLGNNNLTTIEAVNHTTTKAQVVCQVQKQQRDSVPAVKLATDSRNNMPAPGAAAGANNAVAASAATATNPRASNPSPMPSMCQPASSSQRPSVSDNQKSKPTANKNGDLPVAPSYSSTAEAAIIETKVPEHKPIEDEEEVDDTRVVIEDSKTLIERPKRISFSKLESAVNSATATVTPLESVKSFPREPNSSSSMSSVSATRKMQATSPPAATVSEDSGEHPLSPGTPCSQCMREKLEGHQFPANSIGLTSPLPGLNGGQEFFGSSEECCSTGSGCCNSSCAGSCVEAQQPQQQPQQPLSLHVVSEAGRKQHGIPSSTMHHNAMVSSDCSFASSGIIDISSSPRGVATISCPKFETTRLSKISRSVPNDLPGELEGQQRHLVTFVTPSMEAIPLEMCQDIPDVLI